MGVAKLTLVDGAELLTVVLGATEAVTTDDAFVGGGVTTKDDSGLASVLLVFGTVPTTVKSQSINHEGNKSVTQSSCSNDGGSKGGLRQNWSNRGTSRSDSRGDGGSWRIAGTVNRCGLNRSRRLSCRCASEVMSSGNYRDIERSDL